jgi:hypothetical protein
MINIRLIEGKYMEMKKQGIGEDFLDATFGQLKRFIYHKPEIEMVSVQIGVNWVYVGSKNLLVW